MAKSSLNHLLFKQKGKCYFCHKELSIHRADTEHLFAKANGGLDSDENCVAVCRGANRLMSNLPLKEKIEIFRDKFVCPEENGLSCLQDNAPNLSQDLNDVLKLYLSRMNTNKRSRPAKRNSLLNQISSMFALAQGEPEALVTILIERGIIHFEDSKVIWHDRNLQ